MTENEAKAVKFIQNIKNHAVVTLDHIAKEEPNVSPLVYKGRKEKANTILAMVEELQQYRAIGTVEERRAAVEKQNGKKHREMPCDHCRNYDDCKSKQRDNCSSCFFVYPTKEWEMEHTEEYKRGYTKALEECREAVEKQKSKKPIESDEKYGTFRCASCGRLILTKDRFKTHKYCLLCSQKLDWSDEE